MQTKNITGTRATKAGKNTSLFHPGKNNPFYSTNKPFIMKKQMLIIVFFFVAFGAASQQKNALKMNPLSLLAATGNVSYERALSGRQSIQLGGFYSGVGLGDFKYGGYGFIPEIRFYFGSQSMPLNGGYVAPFGRFQHFSITNRELKNKAMFSKISKDSREMPFMQDFLRQEARKSFFRTYG